MEHEIRDLPEQLATQQYVRCLDRLFLSLPPHVQPRMFGDMVSAAVLIGTGVVIMNSSVSRHGRLTPGEREEGRARALLGIGASRAGLNKIARVRRADRAQLLVARELLSRIEQSVTNAEVPAT